MELRDELLDSLILDNTYIKLEDLDKKDKLEKIIPIVKDMKRVGECRYHVVDVYKHSLYSLKELEEAFNEHRSKALEREQKIMRKLQDELNKQKKDS